MPIFVGKYVKIMKLVKPKKNLGQHFLTDLSIAKRIADTIERNIITCYNY